MHILHVTEDHSFANTGITQALNNWIQQMRAHVDATIVCTGGDPLPPYAEVRVERLSEEGLGRSWRHAPGAGDRLRRLIEEADVVHLHGLWMWIQAAAAKAAAACNKPFVLSPHGMLQPWLWSHQSLPHRLKKAIYWRLIAAPAFNHAAGLHALTSLEASSLRRYLPAAVQHLGAPIEIPHSLNLEEVDRQCAQVPPDLTAQDTFVFVGRLHPTKGLHLLIPAFARLAGVQFTLKIAGPEQSRERLYAGKLRRMVASLGLSERVQFLGPVQGVDKWQLYRSAWAVCQPSYSEVIGMVNLEAAAAGTPVIAGRGCGLVEAWNQEGGMLVEANAEDLAEALQSAAGWKADEQAQRGKNLQRLVGEHYSCSATTPKWLDLYQRLAERRL